MRLAFDPTRSTRRAATATDVPASPPGAVEDEWFWRGPAARAELGGWPRALDELPPDDDWMAPEPAREVTPPSLPDEPPPAPLPPPDLGGLELPSDDLLPGG